MSCSLCRLWYFRAFLWLTVFSTICTGSVEAKLLSSYTRMVPTRTRIAANGRRQLLRVTRYANRLLFFQPDHGPFLRLLYVFQIQTDIDVCYKTGYSINDGYADMHYPVYHQIYHSDVQGNYILPSLFPPPSHNNIFHHPLFPSSSPRNPESG